MNATPGLWHVEARGHSGIEVRSVTGTLIATVRGMKGLREANATMLAAAPLMLEALERFAKAIERGHYPELQGVACDAFNAIKAARGEG